MNRGCREMSSVIGPLLDREEASDYGGIADDESRMVMAMSRLPTLFTPVYGCSKNTLKTAISVLGNSRRRTCLDDARFSSRRPNAVSGAAEEGVAEHFQPMRVRLPCQQSAGVFPLRWGRSLHSSRRWLR